ncbi:MAG: DUF2752 domain-containing protein [Phycisphaerales bacterium]
MADATNLPPVSVVESEHSSTTMRRLIALAILLASGAMLGLAAWLEPSHEGHGTHEQLGMPRCTWVVQFDLPCPTCGMTTAFAYAADGHLWQSLRTQPMGFLLVFATVAAFLVSLYVLLSGRDISYHLYPLTQPRTWWIVGGLVLAAWAYKILAFRGVI